MKDTIVIPCEYQPFNALKCHNGIIQYDGDFPYPGKRMTCPICQGRGIATIKKEFIRKQIKELTEDRDDIQEEIDRLTNLLSQ